MKPIFALLIQGIVLDDEYRIKKPATVEIRNLVTVETSVACPNEISNLADFLCYLN